MRVIVNREVIAFSERMYRQSIVIPVEYKEAFFTPFGMFIPLHTSGFGFLRVLRGEVSVEALTKAEVVFELVRVDHLGKVSVLIVDTRSGIQELPLTSKRWTTYGFHQTPVKASNAAYDYLLEGCQTIESAIKRIDHTSAEGFFEPHVLKLEDIAKELIEAECTNDIIFTSTSALANYVKI